MKNLKGGNDGRMLGAAAEYRVISELLLRGYSPQVPIIDSGVDITLSTGVRIQVKSSRLRSHPQFAAGVYIFNLRHGTSARARKGSKRDWSQVCDFFVLWAFEENRFFVMPSTTTLGSIWVQHKGNKFHVPDPETAMRLAAQGLGYSEIAKEMGVCYKTAKCMVEGTRKTRMSGLTNRILQFESRWDLLDVNSAVEKLVESAEPVSVPKEN